MAFELQVDNELTLRLVEPRHADELFAVCETNRDHIAQWMPWLTPGYSIGDARAFCERSLKGFAERKQLSASLVVGGRIVGVCGWTDWVQEKRFDDTLETSTADIGYWLALSHVGRGLMTRAVRALTSLGIGDYGIRRLTIRAEPENERSWRVAERVGYTYEGTLRETCRHHGRRVDHKLYSMLAGQWSP